MRRHMPEARRRDECIPNPMMLGRLSNTKVSELQQVLVTSTAEPGPQLSAEADENTNEHKNSDDTAPLLYAKMEDRM